MKKKRLKDSPEGTLYLGSFIYSVTDSSLQANGYTSEYAWMTCQYEKDGEMKFRYPNGNSLDRIIHYYPGREERVRKWVAMGRLLNPNFNVYVGEEIERRD